MNWKNGTLTLTLAIGMALAAPTAALAQTDTETTDSRTVEEARHRDVSFEEAKRQALQAIAARLEMLSRIQEMLDANGHVSQAHAAQLLAEAAQYERGLSDLAQEIEAAETPEELMELVPRIFEDYHIFGIFVPKVHLVVASDTIVDVTGRLDEIADNLAEAVERVSEAGYDTSEAEAVLAEMESFIAEAADLASGVPGQVLNLKPSDWPEAQQTLEAAFQDVRAAVGNVHAAAEAAHEVVRILRELVGS